MGVTNNWYDGSLRSNRSFQIYYLIYEYTWSLVTTYTGVQYKDYWRLSVLKKNLYISHLTPTWSHHKMSPTVTVGEYVSYVYDWMTRSTFQILMIEILSFMSLSIPKQENDHISFGTFGYWFPVLYSVFR